jgi:hypothetical protein
MSSKYSSPIYFLQFFPQHPTFSFLMDVPTRIQLKILGNCADVQIFFWSSQLSMKLSLLLETISSTWSYLLSSTLQSKLQHFDQKWQLPYWSLCLFAHSTLTYICLTFICATYYITSMSQELLAYLLEIHITEKNGFKFLSLITQVLHVYFEKEYYK